ncbi:MAG TPA: spondin domain-containing protein [Candidatus Acidoferrum sp.]|nr:spondin domain-containing protein [Candidatus Acidoferrum sp.]
MKNRKLIITLLAALGGAPLASAPAHAQYATGREVQFTISVENVSTPRTLALSNGMTAPAPTAPILWTITDSGNPLFSAGKRDRGHGLEQLAEDGNPGVLADYIKENLKSITYSGVVTMPVRESKPGPIGPGKSFEFSVPAAPGQVLSLAMMFGQSNDLFYAPGAGAIALFDKKGNPLSADVTAQLQLWDAGTEVNEEPGLGRDQAPRQSGPNTGPAEKGQIRPVRDRFTYPKVRDVIRVTIRPTETSTSSR